MKAEEIIKTDNLSVGYGKKVVISSINQRIPKGKFVCILGPNGSGKTTILRTLARLNDPLAGVVYLKGRDIYEYKDSELAKHVSVVLTSQTYPSLMTVFEFVAMGRYPYTDILGRLTDQDIKEVEESLRLVSAEQLSDRYLNELSDGERQKVIFARALAQNPDVIMLDEPTVFLDLKHKIELVEILKRSCKEKGITVIVSLHDVELALRVAELVILIKDKRIVAFGEPEEILNENTVSYLYELKYARFNPYLGTINILERKDDHSPKLFVIAGGGTGTPVYRIASKKGFSIATGILHENDVDFFVAKDLGASVISERPFCRIRRKSLELSFNLIKESTCVIDSGFPIGDVNIENLELIREAVVSKKKVISLRKKDELFKFLGKHASKINFVKKPNEILKLTASNKVDIY